MNSICVVVRAHAYGTVWGEGGPGGHVALEGTLYSRVTCPGGRVTLVQSVRGDTVHWGTDSTPTPYTGGRTALRHRNNNIIVMNIVKLRGRHYNKRVT